MSKTLDELLREFGFRPEDFPEPLRANSALIKYAEDLPHELRAEYLGALREFFRVYATLDDTRRREMLQQFESIWRGKAPALHSPALRQLFIGLRLRPLLRT